MHFLKDKKGTKTEIKPIPNLLEEESTYKCQCEERKQHIATKEDIEKYPYKKNICLRCGGKIAK